MTDLLPAGNPQPVSPPEPLEESGRPRVVAEYTRILSEKVKAAQDEKERRLAERALELGITLLRGESVPL